MRTALRVLVLVLAVGVVAMGAVTLNAQAASPGWKACPKPACMMPCSIDPPPEVLCKDRDGGTYVTSFARCCCGGGSTSRYRFL
jgi:hypothetical protein